MTDNPELSKAVQAYIEASQSDLYVFSGMIQGVHERNTGDRFVDLVLRKEVRKPKAAVFFTTYGGDPDSAFRIARCLTKNYDEFRLLVAGPCKSAGTLVALGARDIGFAATGELGPLDVQMAKPDEIALSGSGLDIFTALDILTAHAFDKFEEYMVALTERSGGTISTRTASDIGVKLITGLFQPIAAHIDPVRLGEAQRAINIARAYGKCLGLTNLLPGALEQLIEGYPSHSFVIDLDQATKLFERVGALTADEEKIMNLLGSVVRYPNVKSAAIFDAGATFKPEEETKDEQQATGGSSADSSQTSGGSKGGAPIATNGESGAALRAEKHPQAQHA